MQEWLSKQNRFTRWAAIGTAGSAAIGMAAITTSMIIGKIAFLILMQDPAASPFASTKWILLATIGQLNSYVIWASIGGFYISAACLIKSLSGEHKAGQSTSGRKINRMKIKQILFSFDGRISRREYWLKGMLTALGIFLITRLLSILITRLLSILIGIVMKPVPALHPGIPDGVLVNPIPDGVLANPIIVDIIWIPFGIFLIFIQCAIFAKRWHDLGRTGMWNLLLFIPILGFVLYIPMFIYLGVARGQADEKEYGPVPG